MNIVATVDSSSLNRAIAMALRVTSQEPRNLVINAGRGIALKAKSLTPFVEQKTIDTELGVISTPVLSTRGKRKGLPLKNGRQTYQLNAPRGEMLGPEFLAMRLVLARMWPHSKYNTLTNQRWAIDRMNFSPGRGVKGFWREVVATAKRMVASRHSSTHFLQAGWGVAYRKLTQLRYSPTALIKETIDVESTVSGFDDLGAATLSGGGYNVTLLLENMVGMKGKNAANANEALIKKGSGPLQIATNMQAQEMQARYLPRFEKSLATEWNAIP